MHVDQMLAHFRSRVRGERGATSVIVVVLLVPVLLGAAALSVDVGGLLWERRQVQNGADAAAMSTAQTCARTPASCPTAATAPLTTLAGQNAADNTTTVVSICGNAAAKTVQPALTLCAAPGTPGVVDCPPVPASVSAGAYVEVRTRTRTSGGQSGITSRLASAISGSTSTTPVGACARSAWGAPGAGVTSQLPITISGCDWMHATGGNAGGGGGAYYASPVYNGANAYGYSGSGQPAWPAAAAAPPAQNPGGEVIFMLQNPPSGHTLPNTCPTWQGHALPGGFGVLETTADPCVAKTYNYNWLHTNPGSSLSCDISGYVGKVINLPVYDCTSDALPASPGIPPAGKNCTEGNGSNAWYHMQGWAQFYLSGYRLTTTGSIPNAKKSLVSNTFPCGGGETCISGWFVSGSLTATTISGPPSGTGFFGSPTVLPAG